MFKSRNESNIVYKCTVRLMDDADFLECEFQPFHRGSYLVENICDQLKIKEKDYFGLRYIDSSKQRQWLDVGKSILKQCKESDPILFSFRVKFYPADPFRLTSNGRMMLYQQLKRDLRHGRIYCSIGEAAALGSLIVQEELGDYNEEIHTDNYVSSMNVALRQTEVLEKKVIELHRKREPYLDARETMNEFMGIVCGLETYGIDPHPVKDHCGSQLYIGINYSGISTFVCGKRSQHFRWSEVQKLNFEGKMFIAHLSYTDASREPKKHTIGFKCTSNTTCRYLWRCALEQMLFFTLPNSQNASVVSGGGFFSWGTKFKYTGRTEREILTESINALREQKLNNSITSKRKANSVPATPSTPPGDFEQIRYCSLPRSAMSEPLAYCKTAETECLNNIVLFESQVYDDNDTPVIQFEPVSEESKMYVSNLSNTNCVNVNPDNINYYIRSEDTIVYSTPASVTRKSFDSESHTLQKSTDHIINSCSQSHINKHNSKEKKKYVFSKISSSENAIDQYTVNSTKGVRKFRFINVFIPSLIFVVILMVVSAIFVIESECKLLKYIRNLPEMMSLRYQYYKPLKEYILYKLGIAT